MKGKEDELSNYFETISCRLEACQSSADMADLINAIVEVKAELNPDRLETILNKLEGYQSITNMLNLVNILKEAKVTLNPNYVSMA